MRLLILLLSVILTVIASTNLPTAQPTQPPTPQHIMLSSEDLRSAVTAWCGDPAAATETYGHIATWDTGRVTDMSLLFAAEYNKAGDYYEWVYCSTYDTFNGV